MGLVLEIRGSIALRPIVEEYHPSKSELLLFPKATVQIGKNRVKLGSAFGHKRTLAGYKRSPKIVAQYLQITQCRAQKKKFLVFSHHERIR
jgi:hypothetical protein